MLNDGCVQLAAGRLGAASPSRSLSSAPLMNARPIVPVIEMLPGRSCVG